MSLNRPWILIVLLLVTAFAAIRGRLGGEEAAVRRTQLLMGTVVEIEASGGDATALDGAVDAAFEEMARIEKIFSSNLPESEIGRLNSSPFPRDLSEDAIAVLTVGREVAQKSGGAFDMTLGALKALWDIEGESPRIPSQQAIDIALSDIGPTSLGVEGTLVAKASAALKVDLGGIAKGYAADRAVEVLRRRGVKVASVNAGGDIALLGRKEGRPWRIGVRDPRNPDGIVATVSVDGGSVVTSGDYERAFERDGVRYHHIFDPRTGYPATKSRSVTICAPTSVLADALATAVFVLGPSEGIGLLSAFPGAEGIVIAADGSRHLSEGMKQRVAWR